MEYSIVLFGKDVSKLAYKSNCESLALTDCCGNVRQYFQVVALMLKDKIRMRHKRKNDYDFGECYSVGKARWQRSSYNRERRKYTRRSVHLLLCAL